MQYMEINLFNHQENWIASVGGAGFESTECKRRFKTIPEHPRGGDIEFALDLLDSDGDTIIETKSISIETACEILGESPESIMTAAKARHAASKEIMRDLAQKYSA